MRFLLYDLFDARIPIAVSNPKMYPSNAKIIIVSFIKHLQTASVTIFYCEFYHTFSHCQ
mgnify:CR=1 FL=1